ncbi:hypothetical protein [Escherichia coli]|uniref:hypothetical protein n=1 Tax=Escherichia coli TaxID=562 RepID=UPI0001F66614|nr:hypothetical protein [Escherichia coli]EFW67071.1 hypothetical protein ECoD_00685 [Escherichia coli O157:H7 str. EC1212]EIO77744.1 hypothetical protein ECTW09109_1254 [Escherichia coli TW09109]EIP61860.1 hypothetical protein ECEC1738_1484 [Escherichia coli EC1738]EIN28250.1 restriction enzyme beta subunit [Escherichia coli FDA517]EIN47223.1 restriction enzyme beta subunit [Escherichia coli FRIK1985]
MIWQPEFTDKTLSRKPGAVHKYSYGRQANRTLKNLLVPSLDSVPAWVYGVTGKIISELSER